MIYSRNTYIPGIIQRETPVAGREHPCWPQAGFLILTRVRSTRTSVQKNGPSVSYFPVRLSLAFLQYIVFVSVSAM